MEGDRHQISRRVEFNRFHRLIHVAHGPVGRRKGGKVGHGNLLEVQHPAAPHLLDVRG